MLKTMIRATLFAAVCGMSLAAFARADEAKRVDVPAGDLTVALEVLAKQSGVELIYQSEQLKGLKTNGVSGEMTPAEAVTKLLSGTQLQLGTDPTGAMLIVAPDETKGTAATDSISSVGVGRAADGIGFVGSENSGSRNSISLAQEDTASPSATSVQGDQQGTSESAATSSEKRATLEAVIVTATKRAERAQDIPMSIAVISNQDIERRGLIGMEDYLRSVPGVNQIDRGGQDNAIVIRGITTSPLSENFFAGTTVASYFGETPITGAAGMSGGGVDVRPVDLERIEVLRGPQGTAFGSASLGGTLRMIPTKPNLDKFSAKFTGNYSETSHFGSENSMIQGVGNVPLVVGKFALRAVGYRYDESGFYRNVGGVDPGPGLVATFDSFGIGDYVRGFVEDDVGRMETTGGRFAALWEPTDGLELSLTFLTQAIEQDGEPTAAVGEFEQAKAPIAPPGRVDGEPSDLAETDLDLLSFELNYDLEWATLTTTASRVDGNSDNAHDISWNLGFPLSSTILSDFESFSAEARLASRLPGRVQFLGGLFYESIEEDYFQTLDSAATDVFGTDPLFLTDISRQLDQRAVFGEISYDLTEKLTATVGGRYFDYDKDERSLTEGFGIPIGGGTPVDLKSSESDSNFKAGLSYEPSDASLLYASWAQGFRLGRPQAGLDLCDADGDGLVDGSNVSVESTRSVDSDYLDSYEIGGKFMFLDRRVFLDTAIYRIDWKKLPIITTAGTCGLAYTANGGAATSEGIEFQASLFLTDGLRVDFGAGYTKAELAEPGLGAPAGSRLAGSPKTSANLAVQYEFNLAGLKTFVRADSSYTGKFYGDLFQTEAVAAGDYVKVDARTGVAINNLSIELFVRNLTNEDGFTYRGNFDQGEFFGFRLRPRTIGVQLSYSFE